MDSQVCLHQATKGRTGSARMSYHLKQGSAVLLACGMRDVNGYTRSAKNPADAASRDYRRWKLNSKLKSKPSASLRHQPHAESGSLRRRGPP